LFVGEVNFQENLDPERRTHIEVNYDFYFIHYSFLAEYSFTLLFAHELSRENSLEELWWGNLQVEKIAMTAKAVEVPGWLLIRGFFESFHILRIQRSYFIVITQTKEKQERSRGKVNIIVL
jgi:hypothetical protein